MSTKHIPMLFSAPMVRALLEDRKTNTRRLKFNGQVGDVIWVRETFLTDPDCDHKSWDSNPQTYFEWDGCGRKPGLIPKALQNTKHVIYRASWNGQALSWSSPIHMPRWASRIQLRVTALRKERLQDISEADAIAEGCCATGWMPSYSNPDNAGFDESYSARDGFIDLWESINGPKSWDANPELFVIGLERIKS